MQKIIQKTIAEFQSFDEVEDDCAYFIQESVAIKFWLQAHRKQFPDMYIKFITNKAAGEIIMSL